MVARPRKEKERLLIFSRSSRISECAAKDAEGMQRSLPRTDIIVYVY